MKTLYTFLLFCIIALAGVDRAHGQGAIMPMNLLDRKYKVYVIPEAREIRALGNRRNFDTPFGVLSRAGAVGIFNVGDTFGRAGGYTWSGGRSFFQPNNNENHSIAEDISDHGIVIGVEFVTYGVGALAKPIPRSFIWSETDGYRYLDELFPEVRALADKIYLDNSGLPYPYGTHGSRIDATGNMVIYSDRRFYVVSPTGTVTPIADLDGFRQGFDWNNLGQVPPPGLPPSGPNNSRKFTINTLINDHGDYAGYIFEETGRIQTTTRNGKVLPDSVNTRVNSLNNLGFVGAFPGIIWSPDGTRTDVSAELVAQDTQRVLPAYGFDGLHRPFGDLHINDAGDITLGTRLMLVPQCPELSITTGAFTGFELLDGKIIVRVGTRFTSTAVITNVGLVDLKNPTVEMAPASHAFRQVGGPTPPLPSILLPGQTVSAVLEWEALAPAETSGYYFLVKGESDCGPFETHPRASQIEFYDPPLGIRFDLEPVAEPVTNEVMICDDFVAVATVKNLRDVPITSVKPLSPPTVNVKGIIVERSEADPATPLTIPPGGTVTFRWTMRGAHLGDATLNALFSGTLDDKEFKVGPTEITVVHVVKAELQVNTTGDEPDADRDDECADVDLDKAGRQTTLRAAIEVADATEGEDVITFDLPADTSKTIQLKSPLPPLTEYCEIRGTSQPGGGWVGIDCSAFTVLTGQAAMESKADIKINGLAFTGASKDNAALELTSGISTVQGCRFGLDVDGKPAKANDFSIVITTGGQHIGGTAPGLGNTFGEGRVSVLIAKSAVGAAPHGNVIEGNVFGLTDSGFRKLGPINAIAAVNAAATRIGGFSLGARNHFRSCGGAAIHLRGPETAEADVIGNWFGLTLEGVRVFGSDANAIGIAITDGAHHNRIGGGAAGARNVISASQGSGILMTRGAHDNTVEGNWIGLNGDGTADAGNQYGIWILSGNNHRIGGTTPGQRNVISGNRAEGIVIGRPLDTVFKFEDVNPGAELCTNTFIEGNWIGLDASGTRALPNGGVSYIEYQAVLISRFANGTTVGGDSAGRGNVISGNLAEGIHVDADPASVHAIWGNNIGTSVDGLSPVPNANQGIVVIGEARVAIGGPIFKRNRIAHNRGTGINLAKMKVIIPGLDLAGNLIYDNDPAGSIALGTSRSSNDPGDADSGPNGWQNWPLLIGAVNIAGATKIVLDLSEFTRGIPVRIDVFSAVGGGGKTLLGTSTVTTGSDPKDRYIVQTALQFVGAPITALATTEDGTSEFSATVKVVSGLDSDGDGMPDDLERAAPITPRPPRAPSIGDRNGDSIADATQANVASIQVPDDGDWFTLVAGSGRTLKDLVGLRTADVARLPGQNQTAPGALRFTLEGGSNPELLALWLSPRATVPTVWRWLDAFGWNRVTGPEVETDGGLWKLSFALPVDPADNDYLIAVGQPYTPPPAPVLTLLPRELQTLPRPIGELVAGVSYEGPAAEPPLQGWVQPLTIAIPTAAQDWLLQTSPDLIDWDTIPNERVTSPTPLIYPSAEPGRFFRWSQP